MSNKIKVILQARTGSKRLYGKVILPILNHELVVLCWKRIKLINYDTVVAIPKDSEDDYLAKILKQNKIKYFRGKKNNVFSRYKLLTSKMQPDDIVVRVTADNPLVDGFLIKQIIGEFKKNNYNYISTHDNLKYCPYGLQVEVFKAKHLREKLTINKHCLEHVTPEIRKKYLSQKKFKINGLKRFSKMRLTIDDMNDFKKVNNI